MTISNVSDDPASADSKMMTGDVLDGIKKTEYIKSFI